MESIVSTAFVIDEGSFGVISDMQQPKEQSIRRKLGIILGIGASRTTPTPQKCLEDLSNLEHSTFFTADVLRVTTLKPGVCCLELFMCSFVLLMIVQELDRSLPTQRRLRTMKENMEVVTVKRLEQVEFLQMHFFTSFFP